MSTAKPIKKRIVETKPKAKKQVVKTVGKQRKTDEQAVEMLYKRINYYFLIAGILLIALGFILMSGGNMPSPDVWDESLIYSPRRVILAPIVILAGLVVVIVSIFKK